jgi:hypothetical protein
MRRNDMAKVLLRLAGDTLAKANFNLKPSPQPKKIKYLFGNCGLIALQLASGKTDEEVITACEAAGWKDTDIGMKDQEMLVAAHFLGVKVMLAFHQMGCNSSLNISEAMTFSGKYQPPAFPITVNEIHKKLPHGRFIVRSQCDGTSHCMFIENGKAHNCIRNIDSHIIIMAWRILDGEDRKKAT